MRSMTILGMREIERPAFVPGTGQLAGTPFALFDAAAPARPSRRVLVWRVAVEGYGREGTGPGPWPVRTLEFETPVGATRGDLRALVERASADDLSNSLAGD